MKPRGVHLPYSSEARGQSGAQIENPVFELLSAVQQAGSISHAERQLQR